MVLRASGICEPNIDQWKVGGDSHNLKGTILGKRVKNSNDSNLDYEMLRLLATSLMLLFSSTTRLTAFFLNSTVNCRRTRFIVNSSKDIIVPVGRKSNIPLKLEG